MSSTVRRWGDFGPTLRAIQEHVETTGRPPTYRDLVHAGAVKSTSSAHYHFRRLRELGLVELEPTINRSVSLTAAGFDVIGLTPPGKRLEVLRDAARSARDDIELVLSGGDVAHIGHALDKLNAALRAVELTPAVAAG